MARVHHVKKARKDNSAVKAGEEYWWIKWNYAPKQYFATRPTRAQTTKSVFLSAIYTIEDSICKIICGDDVAEIALQLEELMEECQGSLDNMPEQFKDTSWSAELLQGRIDNLEEWMCALDSADTSCMAADELQQLVEEGNPGF